MRDCFQQEKERTHPGKALAGPYGPFGTVDVALHGVNIENMAVPNESKHLPWHAASKDYQQGLVRNVLSSN
jgi:hypothetical protein